MAKNQSGAARTKRAKGPRGQAVSRTNVVPLRALGAASATAGAPFLLGSVVASERGGVRVVIPALGPEPHAVRSLLPFRELDVGDEVLLAGLSGAPARHVILGRLFDAEAPARDVTVNGRRITLEADSELVLRCAAATIRIGRDGLVAVRGDRVTSEARRTNRIRGGSVEIN